MKQNLLLLVLVGFFCIVQAQVVVDKIDVSYDNPVVTRVAIALSKEASWTYTIDKDQHVVNVSIKDCNVANPIVSGSNKSNLVSDIKLSNNESYGLIAVTLSGPFYIETLTVDNPFKIVLDLFAYKKVYSYQDLLYQAIFYEKSGMYTKASKQYTIMQSNYPKMPDTNYYWGNLYIKQRRPDKAKDKLSAVPQESQFYKQAQTALAKLEGNTAADIKKVEPVVAQDVKKEAPSIEETLPIKADSNESSDTIPIVPHRVRLKHKPFKFFDLKTFLQRNSQKIANSKFIIFINSLPFWFWIIVFVALAIVVLVIFDVIHVRRKMGVNKTAKKTKFSSQNPAKLNMIVKLLEQGWKEKEIAREMQMTPKEAHIYIKQGKKIYAKKAKEKKKDTMA